MRCSVSAIVSRYSCRAICCAPLGKLRSVNHRRYGSVQPSRPGYRRPCRSRKALRRYLACVPTTTASSRARPRVPHRFIRVIWHVNRSEFAGPMQPREHLTIPPIRFHALAAPLRNHRGTHHDAVLAAARQMPMDPEPARPRLVHKVQAPVRRAQRAHDLIERLEIALDHAVVTDLAATVAIGNRDVDRFFVNIQPYEHAT